MTQTLPRLKAVLFDHDGTLVDSEGIHFLLWKEILQPYGISMTEAQYQRHHAGIPTPANARMLVAEHGLSIDAADLVAAKNAATSAHLSRTAFLLMPGAQEILTSLHAAGLMLAVVTGAGRNGVDATVAAYGLSHCFSTVVSGDDVKRSKPAPDCYLLALQRLGIDADECLAIEDTQHGVEAATRAGIACCAVRNVMSAGHDFSSAVRSFVNLQEARQWISKTYALV